MWIAAGTFSAGVLSVWLAAVLALRLLGGWVQSLLSLAAGALLATAFTHLLPEAFESEASPERLFGTLLASVVFFFLLEKAEFYHHGHDHGDHEPHDHKAEARAQANARAQAHSHAHAHVHAHSHGRTHAAAQAHAHHAHVEHSHAGGKASQGHVNAPRAGGWTLLLGDSVHTFCDGVLIAAAFVADVGLGVAATLAVLAHEVPHHVGDFIVLRNAGYSPQRALAWTSAAGCVTMVGGLAGYLAVGPESVALPYLLVIAASSFIYVALADLIPQLQQRVGARQTVSQIFWLAAGIAGMMLITSALHSH